MLSPDWARAPFLSLNASEPRVETVPLGDGAWLLRDPRKLGATQRSIVEYLRHWAAQAPTRTMLAERNVDAGWNRISYAEMRTSADTFAQFLIDREVKPGQRILVLSGNSIEHAIVALGAMTTGVAVVPVSPAYALMPGGRGKLKSVADTVKPALIFAQSGRLFGDAIEEINVEQVPVVCATDIPNQSQYLSLDSVLETPTT